MHRLIAVTVIAKLQLLLFTITRIAFSLGKVHAVLLISVAPSLSSFLLPLLIVYTCLIIPPRTRLQLQLKRFERFDWLIDWRIEAKLIKCQTMSLSVRDLFPPPPHSSLLWASHCQPQLVRLPINSWKVGGRGRVEAGHWLFRHCVPLFRDTFAFSFCFPHSLRLYRVQAKRTWVKSWENSPLYSEYILAGFSLKCVAINKFPSAGN